MAQGLRRDAREVHRVAARASGERAPRRSRNLAARLRGVGCRAGVGGWRDAAPPAFAHEARPAYLEIHETAPGRFDRALAHAGAVGHAPAGSR